MQDFRPPRYTSSGGATNLNAKPHCTCAWKKNKQISASNSLTPAVHLPMSTPIPAFTSISQVTYPMHIHPQTPVANNVSNPLHTGLHAQWHASSNSDHVIYTRHVAPLKPNNPCYTSTTTVHYKNASTTHAHVWSKPCYISIDISTIQSSVRSKPCAT